MPRLAPPAPPSWVPFVLLAAQLAIGSAALFARFGLSGLSPLALSAWRLTLAALVVLLFNLRAAKVENTEKRENTNRPVTRKEKVILALAGLFLAIHFATWFASLQTLSVGRSTLLVCTAPLWTGLVSAVFLKESLSVRFWLGLFLAGIGLAIFVYNPQVATIGLQKGDLWAILGAMAIGAYLLLVQPIQPQLGTLKTVTWTYTSAAVALWAGVLILQENPLPHSLSTWGAILGLALIPQLIGHTIMNAALRYVSPAIIAASTLLEPVIAAILARIFLKETITPLQIVGGIIVLIGMALTLLPISFTLLPRSLASSDTRERDAFDKVTLGEEEENHDR